VLGHVFAGGRRFGPHALYSCHPTAGLGPRGPLLTTVFGAASAPAWPSRLRRYRVSGHGLQHDCTPVRTCTTESPPRRGCGLVSGARVCLHQPPSVPAMSSLFFQDSGWQSPNDQCHPVRTRGVPRSRHPGRGAGPAGRAPSAASGGSCLSKGYRTPPRCGSLEKNRPPGIFRGRANDLMEAGERSSVRHTGEGRAPWVLVLSTGPATLTCHCPPRNASETKGRSYGWRVVCTRRS
jgi:hypothetical protein